MNTPEQSPSNSRTFEAYGACIAAALRLELILRVVNTDTKTKKIFASGGTASNLEARVTKERANATKGTYGQVIKRFLSLHDGEVDLLVGEYLRDSVEFRNYLAHTFLQSHILDFMTVEGLELIRIECEHFIIYFNELETCILENCDADFELFMTAVASARANAEPHPLEHLVNGQSAQGSPAAVEAIVADLRRRGYRRENEIKR